MLKNRGQVTIWIVLSVIIIAAVILFFFFRNGAPRGDVGESRTFNPESFLDECIRDSVNDITGEILPIGGFVNNTNSVTWNDLNVSYLCQNLGYYDPCINQRPQYINEVREEILKEITPEIYVCLEDIAMVVEERKGVFNYDNLDIELSLAPDRIFVNLRGDMSVKIGETIDNFQEFSVEVVNPTYDLAYVATEISSQEAKYCYFEYVGYQLINKRFRITKVTLEDSTRIYSIVDSKTGKELNMAVRGCAIPPGI